MSAKNESGPSKGRREESEVTEEERQVGGRGTSRRGKYPIVIILYQECSTAAGKERKSCNLGSKHARLSSIIQPAGGGEADGERPDRDGRGRGRNGEEPGDRLR